uniref:Serine protease 6 n=1 Tax=Lonomia obliqua TaxID=304329 RepID=Q5MGE3_LONON|nr:serine protease 6 [Lonomia obliqua]
MINKIFGNSRLPTSSLIFILFIVQALFNLGNVRAVPVEGEAEEPSKNDESNFDYATMCGKRQEADEDPQGRITGGTEAAFGDWPWMVYIMNNAENPKVFVHMGGGSLLNKNWAVTAGHLFDHYKSTQILLRFGELDRFKETEPLQHVERTIEELHLYPSYNKRTYENDIALIKFSAVPIQRHIRPVCLPAKVRDYDREPVTVTGWGQIIEDGAQPDILLQAEVEVINNIQCENMFFQAHIYADIFDTIICAGYQRGGKDSCKGDSGGPLVYCRPDTNQYEVIGVVSNGYGCGEEFPPGIYTRVTSFLPWINGIYK